MPEYVIPKAEVFELLYRAMRQGPVMGPKEREDQPGFHYFEWLKNPEEIVTEYITTTIPPKKAFFPPSQTLFSFELGHPSKLADAAEREEFVLAGVHPCDLAAIDELDAAYGFPPADGRWQSDRKRGIIIGFDCMPDEYCFCTSVGACTARRPSDLFLTRLEHGYLAEVFTRAGGHLLEKSAKSPPTEQDMREANHWRRQKVLRTTSAFHASIPDFADILEEGGLAAIWQDVANRCYGCGSCNTTCPTCFCFDVTDDLELNLRKGARRRTWDSCQLPDFALIAGPYNFRGDRWQRVRHRWHRKFLYLYRKYGRPYCTGCGRCSRACTVDINIVDVSNQLIGYSRSGQINHDL
jgi:sulfhydrogenase subunit beta (sulfur reductase)